MDQKTLELIMAILAVGSAVGPMFFGWMMYRMQVMFLLRREFDVFKETVTREREVASQQRQEMKDSIDRIAHDIAELLQRTARLRKDFDQ